MSIDSSLPAPVAAFHDDSEDAAERYVLHRMSRVEKQTYQRHLTECEACAAAVEQAQVFADAMRGAALQILMERGLQKAAGTESSSGGTLGRTFRLAGAGA